MFELWMHSTAVCVVRIDQYFHEKRMCCVCQKIAKPSELYQRWESETRSLFQRNLTVLDRWCAHNVFLAVRGLNACCQSGSICVLLLCMKSLILRKMWWSDSNAVITRRRTAYLLEIKLYVIFSKGSVALDAYN